MFKIQKLNKISSVGLDLLPHEKYEYASEITNPDAILVRSHSMHDMELPDSLKAIARAGAGVNNIPIEKCTEKGIVVFNTPGANANGVKELVLTGLFLSSRKIFDGISWAKGLVGKGDEVPKIIEKEKSNFAGPEIKGKTLGIVGLGAIGVMVANDALALGMNVVGLDPFISVDAAWGLSRNVKKAISLDSLLSESDYISLHVPLNDKTKGMLNKDKFATMKKGVRIINFARGGLVNNEDLKDAFESGIVSAYVTDFPDEELIKLEQVIPIPHLGASTPESEDNCAKMAVNQVMDFLENGNVVNSVNFPECFIGEKGKNRIIVANKNVPAIIGKISNILGENNINITDMINKSKGDIAFNIIDIDDELNNGVIDKLKAIDGIIMARML
ncbi:phosphoglycerate dehydrogenase [Spirochaetota bacterium]